MNKYSRSRACPKCGSNALLDQYQEGAHRKCSLSSAVEDLSYRYDMIGFFKGYTTDAMYDGIESLNREIAEVPEHIERECYNCKARWAEEPLNE